MAGMPKKVGITASGVRARPGTLAADTALFPFGTKMHIPGYGYGVVQDRGGDIRGRHIDLYFRSHRAALEWGRQKVKVRVWEE
jgi:3D (Asp-Asp-Asp) domain-containing protein